MSERPGLGIDANGEEIEPYAHLPEKERADRMASMEEADNNRQAKVEESHTQYKEVGQQHVVRIMALPDHERMWEIHNIRRGLINNGMGEEAVRNLSDEAAIRQHFS